MDARGPMEARLLALERRLVHIDDAIRKSQVSLVGLGQGIWDAWGDRQIPTGEQAPTPTPTPTGTFPDCCPGYDFPSTLTLVDNVYGNWTLTFDGVSEYSGCKQISFGGHGSCAAVSMPLWYWMDIDGVNCTASLNMGWVANFAGCPDSGKDCTHSRPTPARTAAVTLGCSGDTMTWHLTAGSGPHPNGSTANQSITLP